jgi:hypothetical protein
MVDGIQGPGGTSPMTQSSGDGPDLNTNFDDLISQSDQIGSGDSMYYLKLQQKISQEALVQQTLSNVIKARSDMLQSTARNIGG